MKYLAFLIVVAVVFAVHSSARAGAFSLEIIAQAGDVIDGRTIIGFSGEQLSVKINNNGEVAFFADFSSGFFVDLGLLTQNRFIAGAGKVIDGRALGFGSEPYLDMNHLGDVTYQADWNDGRGIFVNETLLVQADVTVIDGHTVRSLSKSPKINDTGTVLFSADTLEFSGVFTQSELLIRTGQSFEGLTISGAGGLQNNAGHVVFGVSFREIAERVLFTFDDGILVKVGDVIDGLTVRKIRWTGLTDAGQLYMKIDGLDAGGEQIHFIATPRSNPLSIR